MTTMIQTLLKRSDLDYATFTDSVSKFRVSTPESLIDTDFEYGLQGIKWETIQLVNNIPLFFSRSGDTPIPMSSVQTTINTDYVYVTTVNAHNMVDGSPMYISGLKSVTSEGYFLITKVLSPVRFVYRAKYTQTVSGSLFDANTSYLYSGMVYQGTSYTADQLEYISTDEAVNSTLEVKTLSSHGFGVGTNFALTSTIGKRIVQFDASTTTTNTITTTTNHNMFNGMTIVYSNNGNISLTGLTDSSQYTVLNTTANTLQLSTNGSIAVTISSGTGIHSLASVDDASDGSTYTISSVPSVNTFRMYTSNQISRNSVSFNYRTNIVQQGNGNSTRAIF